MRRVYWLASYPKSGSTWVRSFLSALTHAGLLDLDQLGDFCPNLADRERFDLWSGLDSANLTLNELENLRADVYTEQIQNETGLFYKTHERFRLDGKGRPLFPPAVSAGVIYILRHPFAVAPSWAAHMGWSQERTVAEMRRPQEFYGAERMQLSGQLPQQIGRWDQHLQSWRDSGLPFLLIRYEDLHLGSAAFARLANFAGLRPEQRLLERAHEACRFEKLREFEAREGFAEASPAGNRFFRLGRPISDELSESSRRLLWEEFGESMLANGYRFDGTQSKAWQERTDRAQPFHKEAGEGD